MQSPCGQSATNNLKNVMRIVRQTVGKPVAKRLGLANVTLEESVDEFVTNWLRWLAPGETVTDKQLATEYLDANDFYQRRFAMYRATFTHNGEIVRTQLYDTARKAQEALMTRIGFFPYLGDVAGDVFENGHAHSGARLGGLVTVL